MRDRWEMTGAGGLSSRHFNRTQARVRQARRYMEDIVSKKVPGYHLKRVSDWLSSGFETAGEGS